jgi:hypothetical protein
MKTIFAILLGISLASAASAEEPVLSGGISHIVKMSKSGVAPSVVQQYINSSKFPFRVTPDDLLHLQKEGVPAEIITTLIRHGEEIRLSTGAIRAVEARKRAAEAAGAGAREQPQYQVVAPMPPPPAPHQQPPVVYHPPSRPTYTDLYPAYPSYPYYPHRGYYDRGYGPTIGLGFGFSFGGSRGGGYRGHR